MQDFHNFLFNSQKRVILHDTKDCKAFIPKVKVKISQSIEFCQNELSKILIAYQKS